MFSNLKYEEKRQNNQSSYTFFCFNKGEFDIFDEQSHWILYNYYSDIHSGSTLWNLATIQF